MSTISAMRCVFNQDIAKTAIVIVLFGIVGAPRALADGASCGKGVGGVDMGVYPMSNVTSLDQAASYTNGGLIGNGQCATLTKALTPGLGHTPDWTRGVQVQGDGAIPVGAPIATFNFSSGPGSTGYGPSYQPQGDNGVSHTGIYLGQDRNGIWILDQWSTSPTRKPTIRQLPWGPGGSSATGSTCSPNECGGKYYVIGNGNGANSPPNAALNGGDGSGGAGGADTGGLCSVPSPGGGYTDISGGGGNGGGSTGGGGMGGVGGGGTTGPGGTGGVGGGGTGGGTTGGGYGGGGTDGGVGGTGGGTGIGSATFGPVPTLPRAQGANEIPILEGTGE